MKAKRKTCRLVSAILLGVCLLGLVLILGINAYVKHSAADRILTTEEATELNDIDCILVLGCYVRADGSPSDMLVDRLTMALELYNAGIAPKLLMSGDHSKEDYDEVGVMKDYAAEAGVDTDNILTDEYGLSTYESLYRAKELFGAEKVVIVTQEYHLYRALYIAQECGIEAYGVASDYHTYTGMLQRTIREVLARNKDFYMCLFKREN